jgi:hypothetical protein
VAAPVEDSADLLMGGGGEDSAPPAYDVADSLMGGAPAPEAGAAAALDGFGFEADAAYAPCPTFSQPRPGPLRRSVCGRCADSESL